MKHLIYNLISYFPALFFMIIPQSIVKKIRFSILFSQCSINFNTLGFWFISPLPSQKELQDYYSLTYYNSIPMLEGINIRDIDHYIFLKEFIPQIRDKSPMTVLNFGSGHGGISHLLFLDGHKVINVDPKVLHNNHSRNWYNLQSIDEVNQRVDLIYSSQSLNCVRDVSETLEIMGKILMPGGYYFFEVPNAEKLTTENSISPKISPPQTHYFKEYFFDSLQFHKIFLGTYINTSFPNIYDNAGRGDVIRFIGKKIA
jgi:SAM-dependent methyltransferase